MLVVPDIGAHVWPPGATVRWLWSSRCREGKESALTWLRRAKTWSAGRSALNLDSNLDDQEGVSVSC